MIELLFKLSFTQKHDEDLASLRLATPAEEMRSAAAISPPTCEALWKKYQGDVQAASVNMMSNMTAGRWPASQEAFTTLLSSVPADGLAWRQRCLVLMAITKNMVFVIDDTVAKQPDLLVLLTVARLCGIKTMGFIPAGADHAVIPLAILSATDIVLSGEADGDHARAILRSLL